MAIARIFIGLVLIFIFVAFSLRNMTPISVDLYLRKTPELPLFVWLFFSALFGVVVAWLVAVSEQLRMRGKLKKERKERKELEEKLEKLKKDLDGLEEKLRKQRETIAGFTQPTSEPISVPPAPVEESSDEPEPTEPFDANSEIDFKERPVAESSDEPEREDGASQHGQ